MADVNGTPQLPPVPTSPGTMQNQLAPAPSPEVSHVTLTEQEWNRIRLQRDAVHAAKLNLGELTMKIMEAEDQRRQIANAIQNGARRCKELIEETARTHGIDLLNPQYAGQWGLNQDTQEFYRVGPAPQRS